MSAIQCPFCGASMSSPLKFCVSCGRAVSEADMAKAGLRIYKGPEGSRRGEGEGSVRFSVSKKSYGFHRQIRAWLWTSSTVLALLLVYYTTMRFVLHEHLPGNVDKLLENFFNQQPTTR